MMMISGGTFFLGLLFCTIIGLLAGILIGFIIADVLSR